MSPTSRLLEELGTQRDHLGPARLALDDGLSDIDWLRDGVLRGPSHPHGAVVCGCCGRAGANGGVRVELTEFLE